MTALLDKIVRHGICRPLWVFCLLFFSDELSHTLRDAYTHVVVSKLLTEQNDEEPADVRTQREANVFCIEKLGRILELPQEVPLEKYTVVFVGDDNFELVHWMMNLSRCRFCLYNAESRTAELQTMNVNKLLMKRYYMIEKAKDAGIVGILAGTLGVKDRLVMIERLKRIIKAAGKKSYLFVVGFERISDETNL